MSKIRKRKAERAKRYKILTVSGIVVLSVISLYSFFTRASMFDVKTVDVVGSQKLPKEMISLYSGVAIGENIVKVSEKDVKLNLKSEPYIKDVNLVKKFPDKIILNITEKKDAVVINGSKKIYLDSSSEVLSIDEELKSYSVPLLEGLLVDSAIISNKVKYKNNIEEEEFKALLRGASSSYLNQKLSRIEITEKENVNLVFKEEGLVKLGAFKEIDYKINYLKEIIKDLNEKGKRFETIDFSNGNKVIVEEKLVREEK